jgi:DNA mismatch repair protein MutL
LYERLTGSSTGSGEISPVQIALTAVEADLLSAHLPLFAGLGFEVEPFGGQAFLLRRIPAALKPHLGNQVAHSTQPLEAILLTTLLEELQTGKTLAPEAQRDRLAQKAACICACKAGDILSPKTMQTLLDDLVETWSPAACPHGRPVFISLSLAELERRFGRR